jgi:glyoxylase-like metal-dependent hydrolase (beta-lactamase superfamily II)
MPSPRRTAPELYLFDSGTLGLEGVQVPVPFFLIRHPQGNVVIDGGNPLAVARDARGYWGPLADEWEVRMSEEQHCAIQLKRLGVGPDSVRYVVQTHLHIDHTGALGHFPGATVVVHARELKAARVAEPPVASGYLRQDYERPNLQWRLIDGELDLCGDGCIRLLETPGHSAGHMSVLLQLQGTGAVLLTGDASDNAAEWEGKHPPRGLFSPDQAMRSLEALRRVARETGALIVFGHDPDDWAQHRRAPDPYS